MPATRLCPLVPLPECALQRRPHPFAHIGGSCHDRQQKLRTGSVSDSSAAQAPAQQCACCSVADSVCSLARLRSSAPAALWQIRCAAQLEPRLRPSRIQRSQQWRRRGRRRWASSWGAVCPSGSQHYYPAKPHCARRMAPPGIQGLSRLAAPAAAKDEPPTLTGRASYKFPRPAHRGRGVCS